MSAKFLASLKLVTDTIQPPCDSQLSSLHFIHLMESEAHFWPHVHLTRVPLWHAVPAHFHTQSHAHIHSHAEICKYHYTYVYVHGVSYGSGQSIHTASLCKAPPLPQAAVFEQCITVVVRLAVCVLMYIYSLLEYQTPVVADNIHCPICRDDSILGNRSGLCFSERKWGSQTEQCTFGLPSIWRL